MSPAIRTCVHVLALLWTCIFTRDIGAQVYGFPFTVQNPTSVDRVNEPVATGLALPWRIPLLNPNTDLQLVDDANQPVPVQFKPLSRWGGTRDDYSKVCKWILVTFNADVAANSTRTYYLRFGPRTNGAITIQEFSNEVVVNTQSATFKLDKSQFSFFKQVNVGNALVTSTPGLLEVRDVSNALVPVTLDSTVVEEPGTVRCVVRQKGRLIPLGLAFTVRYYFFDHRTDVKVDFRLENNGAYGQVPYTGTVSEHGHFEDLRLVVRLAENATNVVVPGSTRTLSGQAWNLDQNWTPPSNGLLMLSGFNYAETVGGTTAGSGNRFEGATSLNSPSGGVAVAVDRFWQNFPKAFKVMNNRLEIALWPSFGNGPEYSGQYGTFNDPTTDPLASNFYRFEGGRWKSHTMRIDFRAGAPFQSEDVQALASSTAFPLMGMGPTNWPFRCFAFGSMVVERRNWDRTSFQRYERFADILAHDSAADSQPSLGQIGLPKFRERGGTYGGQLMYGWDNYGDIAWGDGYSSLHYDIPYGVLINFYRTGDYAFFDVGRDLAQHRIDYDTLHSTSTSVTRRGGQFYEKGFFHGNYDAPQPSHLWIQGVLLYHVMTGDEGARETALETFGYIQRMHPETWNGWWGSRILGWQLEALCDLYNYLGDSQYVQLAQATAQNWMALEAANGAQGCVPNPGWNGSTYPIHEQTWMHAIVMNALGKYFTTTFDASIIPCYQRMTDWLMVRAVKSAPTGLQTYRTPGKVWGRANATYQSEPSTHHLWCMTEAFAYGALILHSDSYMAMARDLYESVTRYHQITGGDESPRDFTNPSTFSKVAFRMTQYPNAETKIMGNIGLWSHTYPMARLLWDYQF